MLGNIIFVGQLYRFGVLIEAVMHSCIKQLLEEVSVHAECNHDIAQNRMSYNSFRSLLFCRRLSTHVQRTLNASVSF